MLSLPLNPIAASRPFDTHPALDVETLLQRTCVRPPYFALQGLRSPQTGTARAFVKPEQSLGAEAGPVAGAEVGRHLAILGSAALASLAGSGEQRYHLARAAHLERVCDATTTADGPLVATAVAAPVTPGARSATVRCLLRTADGVTTHRFHVEYLLLTARQYERTFPVRRQVPVARLMEGLTAVAGQLFQRRIGDPRASYVLMRGDVRALAAAYAGDPLTLRAEHVRDCGEESAFHCRAVLEDGSCAGELDLWLARA